MHSSATYDSFAITYSPSSCFKPVWISSFCWTHTHTKKK